MNKLFEKYINKNNFIIFFILMISVIACMPYAANALYSGDDLPFHLNRIEGIRLGILSGQFPVKIYPVLNGYGYANGIFYPDLFLYFPALLRIIGVGVKTSFKIFMFVTTILTAVSMYYSTYKISKSKRAAVIGTILYVLSPYRLIDVFNRSAVGEILAFIFIPLIIYGVYEIIHGDSKKIWPLVLGILGIINSHILSILIVGIMGALIVLFNLKVIFTNKDKIIAFIYAAIFSLLLSSYVWIPLLEQNLCEDFIVNHSKGLYDLYSHAIPAYQLFENIISNQGDLFVFIGSHILIVSIITIYLYLFEREKHTIDNYVFKLTITGLILSVMATKAFPWGVFQNSLGNLQFPWRFLLAATPVLCITAAITLKDIISRENAKISIVIISILTMMIVNPIFQCRVKYFEIDTIKGNELGNKEYLPYGTDYEQLLKSKSKQYYADNKIDIGDYYKNGTNINFQFSNNKNKYIELPLVYYKGYCAEVISADNKSDSLDIEKGTNNLVKLDISKYDNGKIKIYYKGTIMQKLSYILTAIMIVILLFRRYKLRLKGNGRGLEKR